MRTCVGVHAWRSEVNLGYFSSDVVHLFPLSQGLSLCLELTYQERLDRQETPEIHLSLSSSTKISSIWYYIQPFLK